MKKQIIYKESQNKTYGDIPFWRRLQDENFNLIYREHNGGYNGSIAITFYI